MTKQKLMILISVAILVTIVAVVGIMKSMKPADVDHATVTDQTPAPADADQNKNETAVPVQAETIPAPNSETTASNSPPKDDQKPMVPLATETLPQAPVTTPGFSDDENKTAKPGKFSETKKAKKNEEPAKPNCFAAEYRHTKKMQAEDIEEFLDYTNAYALTEAGTTPETALNTSSVCVKVNGQVIKHKVIQNKGITEALIGSVVGPESVIRVSYCVGKKSNCSEPCVAKQKRFMDDMMSDAEGDADFKDAPELQAKVKELRHVASQSEELSKQSVMRTWDTIKSQDWTCKKGK